jgi:hypothetical protein
VNAAATTTIAASTVSAPSLPLRLIEDLSLAPALRFRGATQLTLDTSREKMRRARGGHTHGDGPRTVIAAASALR